MLTVVLGSRLIAVLEYSENADYNQVIEMGHILCPNEKVLLRVYTNYTRCTSHTAKRILRRRRLYDANVTGYS